MNSQIQSGYCDIECLKLVQMKSLVSWMGVNLAIGLENFIIQLFAFNFNTQAEIRQFWKIQKGEGGVEEEGPTSVI